MSLLKQLLISVSLAIIIILGGTLWLSVDSARSYLNTQLQSQTDSAATSLALTLSQAANQDPITQELIIMAQFDSGQFNQIQLTDTQGEVLFNRLSNADYTGDAPIWFQNLLPVIAAESGALVSDGWRQVGELYLKADASYARDSLWHSFTRLVAWVLGAGILWALFVLFLMRWLRRVLHEEVAQQLNALTSKDAGHSQYQPRKSTFSELAEVTQAIASARENILITTEEQNAKIESLEVELNQDPVTGLVNRKYFINELRRLVEEKQVNDGVLFIFRQRDLAEINRLMSRANVDDWLKSVSQQVQQLADSYQKNSSGKLRLARLNGSDFAILAVGLETESMQSFMDEVQLILRQQRIQLPDGEFCRWAMAQTDFKAGQLLAHIMGRLDQALMRAESAGHNLIEVLTSAQADKVIEQPKGGETQWRTIIQDALAHNGFSLSLQAEAVIGEQLCHETTLLLHPKQTEAEVLSGYQFMPVATRLGLSAMCDLRTFELAAGWLAQHPKERLIIRVSLSSITQATFTEKVADVLQLAGAAVTPRLHIELDAYAVISEPVAVAAFSAVLHNHQVKLGIRRALSIPHVLLELSHHHTDYVRVLAQDINELTSKAGGVIMLRSALDIAKQANVRFVVTGAEVHSAEVIAVLRAYGVNIAVNVV